MQMLAEVSSTMESESDEDLLLYMGMKNDDPDEAQLACTEFYRRHKRYLLYICVNACRLLPDPYQDGMDLMSATFYKVYEKADSFIPLDNGSDDDRRRYMLAWVGTIAQNILIDGSRADKAPEVVVSLEDLNEELPFNNEKPELSPNAKLVIKAVEEVLNEKERMVILLQYNWYEVGKPNQRLPNGVCEEIAESIGSTKQNVRQIHSRAKQKIKQYMEQHANF